LTAVCRFFDPEQSTPRSLLSICVNGSCNRTSNGGRLMTGKLGLTAGLMVWLVYVAWMASYYFGTFSLFAH